MKISAINTQSFKAFHINPKIVYTETQDKIIQDIYEKSGKIEPKYDKTSLLGYLKSEYDMDLFADANSDKKSINLYISEVLPTIGKGSNINNTKLTFIGNYSSGDSFNTHDVDLEIDRITGKKGTNLVNSISTIVATLGLFLIPVLGVIMLAKDKSASKIEQILKNSNDNLKISPKDTLNLAKKIK